MSNIKITKNIKNHLIKIAYENPQKREAILKFLKIGQATPRKAMDWYDQEHLNSQRDRPTLTKWPARRSWPPAPRNPLANPHKTKGGNWRAKAPKSDKWVTFKSKQWAVHEEGVAMKAPSAQQAATRFAHGEISDLESKKSGDKYTHTYNAKDPFVRGERKVQHEFKKQKQHGHNKVWHPQGHLISHKEYKDGKEHGVHRAWSGGGDLYKETHYREGEKHGADWFEGSTIGEDSGYSNMYQNGKLHGPSRVTRSNGIRTTGDYKNGAKHGHHKEFKGKKLISHEEYKDGKLVKKHK